MTTFDLKRRLLVVDDYVDWTRLVELLFTSLGYEVRVAHTGTEALRAAGEFAPDAVLLDIGLPDMSGYELAMALRRMPNLSGIVMAAVTGHSREEDIQRSRDAGIDHHLVKPVDMRALRALLEPPSP